MFPISHHVENFTVATMTWLTPLWNICVTNDHGYVPLVVNTSRSFPHSRLITGFLTRLTRRVPLVEQELLTLLEHLSSPPVFSGVRVTQSFVLYVCFVDRCLSFCVFSSGHCVVCSSSIYLTSKGTVIFCLTTVVNSNPESKVYHIMLYRVHLALAWFELTWLVIFL